jgi:hypothetical protein
VFAERRCWEWRTLILPPPLHDRDARRTPPTTIVCRNWVLLRLSLAISLLFFFVVVFFYFFCSGFVFTLETDDKTDGV